MKIQATYEEGCVDASARAESSNAPLIEVASNRPLTQIREASCARVVSDDYSCHRVPNRHKRLREEVIGTCAICLDPMTKNLSIFPLDCQHQFHTRCIATWTAICAANEWRAGTLKSGLPVTCPTCRQVNDFKQNDSTFQFYQDISELTDIIQGSAKFKHFLEKVVDSAKEVLPDGSFKNIDESGYLTDSFWRSLDSLQELSEFLDASSESLIDIARRLEILEIDLILSTRGPSWTVGIKDYTNQLVLLSKKIDAALRYEIDRDINSNIVGLYDDLKGKKVHIRSLESLHKVFFKQIPDLSVGNLLEIHNRLPLSESSQNNLPTVEQAAPCEEGRDNQPATKRQRIS